MVDLNVVALTLSILALLATLPFWIRSILYYVYSPETVISLGNLEKTWIENSITINSQSALSDIELHISNQSRHEIIYQIEYSVPSEVKIDLSLSTNGHDGDLVSPEAVSKIRRGEKYNSSITINESRNAGPEPISNEEIIASIQNSYTAVVEKLNDLDEEIQKVNSIDKISYGGSGSLDKTKRIKTNENFIDGYEHKRFVIPLNLYHSKGTVVDMRVTLYRKLQLSRLMIPEFFGPVKLKPAHRNFTVEFKNDSK